MIGRTFLALAMVLLGTIGCAPAAAPGSGQARQAEQAVPRSASPRTLTIGINGSVDALLIMGSSTTSGGWQSVNELHLQGLVTADRDVQRPVA
jgi:hypothetical protein